MAVAPSLTLRLAGAFEIEKPYFTLDRTNVYRQVGTTTNRGFEFSLSGALTDRFSSRSLMLGSDIIRVVLVAFMAALVLMGAIELWMIYLFALTFGLVDAFFYPALNAMVPHLVKEDQLQAGNAIVQGTGQLALFAGPVVAGLLIAVLDGGTPSGETARTVPEVPLW